MFSRCKILEAHEKNKYAITSSCGRKLICDRETRSEKRKGRREGERGEREGGREREKGGREREEGGREGERGETHLKHNYESSKEIHDCR